MAMCEIGEMAQEGELLLFTEEMESIRFEGIRLINCDLMGLKFISQYKDKVKGITRFLEIARRLSRMIPKISDESLLVIDDNLYENDEEYQEYPELKSDDLDGLEIELYNKHYIDMIDKGFYSSELDNIYIRLAENLEGDHFEWIFRKLAPSRDVRKICLFLKIFKSCLSAKMDKAVSNIKDMAISLGIPFFLMKLSKIPKLSDDTDDTDGYHMDNVKIVKFIAEQADACLKSFESDTMNLEEPKKFIQDSLVYFEGWDREWPSLKRFDIWEYVWPSYYQYILLDVFMSAKDVNEEKEFLLVFQKALNRFCSGKGTIDCGFASIFRNLSDNLISIARYIVEEHFEEDMRLIDELHGYNIEPYGFKYELPEGVKDPHEKINKLAAMDIINNLLTSQIVKEDILATDVDTGFSVHLQYSDFVKDLQHQVDTGYHLSEYLVPICQPKYKRGYIKGFTIDSTMKFLIYDDFMKCLHLMSILHTAYVKYEDIKDFDKDEMPIYFGGKFGLSCFAMPRRNKLHSVIRNKKVSWPLEMAITKCPFLYFIPSGYHLKEEYLMLLKGEDIDETLREEILDNLY